MTLNVLSALIIGITAHMLTEIILFIFTYKSLRKYVGGSHSPNARSCYITSCITYAIALAVIAHYPLSSLVSAVMVIICSVIMYIIAPVEAEKKPLDDIERKVYRRRSRLTIIIFLSAFMLLHYIPNVPYGYYCSTVISVGIFTVTVFAVEGKIQQILRIRKKAIPIP